MSSSRQSNPNLLKSRLSHHNSRSQFGMKSVIGGSISKRNVAFDSKLDKPLPKKAIVQVFDDFGNDVTPRSLLSTDIVSSNSSRTQSKSIINFNDSISAGTPSDIFNQSMFGQSTLQASYAAGFSKSIMSSMMGSSRASLDSVTDEISEPTHGHGFAGLQEIERVHTAIKEEVSAEDLNKTVNITLEETDTIWHLDIPGCAVSSSSDNAEEITDRNKKYEMLCNNRSGNDMYVQRGMQTFNDASKSKEMQTTFVEKKDIGVMATNWDIYDTYNVMEEVPDEENGDDDLFTHTNESKSQIKEETSKDTISHSISQKSQSQFGQSQIGQSYVTDSSASFISSSSLSAAVQDDDDARSERSSLALSEISSQLAKIMKTESMKTNVFIMERSVVQNLYHPKQAVYRGLEDLNLNPCAPPEAEEEETPAAKLGPNLSRLWSYECSATKGMAVNCLVWNKTNHDLLAAGYGENGCKADGKGLACIWSIKNPEHPERMFTLISAVTSIDFSSSHPNFLAVGLYNGTIAVYNIRQTNDAVVLDCVDSVGKHSSPVWQLKWIERDKGSGEEKGEVLISTSADGRVTQWSIRKGFEYLDLMKLKRQNTTKQVSGGNKRNENTSKKSDALISRYAAGMCFDFHPNDGNMYIAGTEEGFIHKCSCSYNEQFLETYSGHKGAVYQTTWSPFDRDVFLSCSADWTVKLWHCEKTQPVLSLQSASKAVLDIDWSPISAVIFAAINEAQIEIWDLSVSTLDPLLVNLPVSKVSLTAIKFALNSEALLVGDSEGHVTIYQLREMNLDVKEKNQGWLSRVMNATAVSQNVDEMLSSEKNNDSDEAER